jgi:hypothetical protein
MWWGGAGEDLPEEGSRFDVAYSLRASTYRGQRQASILFEEFRIIEAGKPPEIRLPQVEVIDLRGIADPEHKLAELAENFPGLEVWAEGWDRNKGRSRFELRAAEELAIYTSPPSARDLREALRNVHPKRIYLFALSGGPEDVDGYLNQLAGLCRYAINRRSGKATISQLAAACAQRTASVRLGLEWLRAGGHISIQGETDLELTPGSDMADPNIQTELYLGVKGILEETASYRAYFAARMDPTGLIEG